MYCTKCGTEMEIEEVIMHYNDPGDEFGYGEFSSDAWVCPECGEAVGCGPEDDTIFYGIGQDETD